MNAFCIKDLENLSGIKAHTIRIWEKRYNLIKPERTSTNLRRYNDNQLKKILNVSLLINEGYKISKIADFSTDKLQEIVCSIHERKNDNNVFIDQMIKSCIDYDEEEVSNILNKIIDEFGIIDGLQNIIFPFANKFGVLWQTNVIKPSHEHFIINLIRQKIISSINQIQIKSDNNKEGFILFLPNDEFLEIYLLFYYFYLKEKGNPCIYLGQNTSKSTLTDIVERHPNYTLLSCVSPKKACMKLSVFIKPYLDRFKKQKFYAIVPPNYSTDFKHSRFSLIKNYKNLLS
jgi:MerR family transcriptional regulator, light-induced transcriptional regulator